MKKIDYLNELKELDILLIKNMFFAAKGEKGNVKRKKIASPLQLRICKCLKDNKKNEVSQSDLERELNVSRATISSTITAMEKHDIVERIISDKDGRMKYVRLTENSLKSFKDMEKRLDELNNQIVKDIPKNDLFTFLSVLTKMKANLQPPTDKTKVRLG